MCSSQTFLNRVRKRLNWDDLRFFYALADSSSMTSAARKLKVSYMTVSRRIEKLEETLHKELFVRSTDGYTLTEYGSHLYEKVQVMHDAADHLVEDLSKENVIRRKVSISTVHSLAYKVITPGLSKFQKKYNNITYDIQISDRNISLSRREADIAIRLGEKNSDEESTIKIKLGVMNYFLCGSHSIIRLINQGKEAPLITFTDDMWHLKEVHNLVKKFSPIRISFQSNSTIVQRSAAIAGFGIALLPQSMIENTDLKMVSDTPEFSKNIWLITKKQSYGLTAVRLIVDELVSVFGKYNK